MAQLREIRKRIKAVANIQRITHTMQMIATGKFQAALRHVEATRPYQSKLAELVRELADALASDPTASHPLLLPPRRPTGKELLLVITSNRGLCGAYNTNVLRTAMGMIRERGASPTLVQVAGRKGAGFFRFTGVEVEAVHAEFGDAPAFEQVEELADRCMQRYEAGAFDAMHVASTHFISNARQVAKLTQLIPVPPPERQERASGLRQVYEFIPAPQELLGHLLPACVRGLLFQCFNDAAVCEHIARMVAMKAATDNASKMGRTLRRQFNRARQTQITTELTEIIGGAAAIQ